MNLDADWSYVTVTYNNMFTNETLTIWCPYSPEDGQCSIEDIVSFLKLNVHDFDNSQEFRIYLRDPGISNDWNHIANYENLFVNSEIEVMTVIGPKGCHSRWSNIIQKGNESQYLMFPEKNQAVFNYDLMKDLNSQNFREIRLVLLDTFSNKILKVVSHYINMNMVLREIEEKYDSRLEEARNSSNRAVIEWRRRRLNVTVLTTKAATNSRTKTDRHTATN